MCNVALLWLDAFIAELNRASYACLVCSTLGKRPIRIVFLWMFATASCLLDGGLTYGVADREAVTVVSDVWALVSLRVVYVFSHDGSGRANDQVPVSPCKCLAGLTAWILGLPRLVFSYRCKAKLHHAGDVVGTS